MASVLFAVSSCDILPPIAPVPVLTCTRAKGEHHGSSSPQGKETEVIRPGERSPELVLPSSFSRTFSSSKGSSSDGRNPLEIRSSTCQRLRPAKEVFARHACPDCPQPEAPPGNSGQGIKAAVLTHPGDVAAGLRARLLNQPDFEPVPERRRYADGFSRRKTIRSASAHRRSQVVGG